MLEKKPTTTRQEATILHLGPRIHERHFTEVYTRCLSLGEDMRSYFAISWFWERNALSIADHDLFDRASEGLRLTTETLLKWCVARNAVHLKLTAESSQDFAIAQNHFLCLYPVMIEAELGKLPQQLRALMIRCSAVYMRVRAMNESYHPHRTELPKRWQRKS